MKTIVFYRNHRGAVVQRPISIPFDLWFSCTNDVAELFAVIAV